MIGRLNYSEGCNKCGSTDFIREAQAKSNEYITFHLCKCGNVMISIKRRYGYLPTPESHDPLTKQLMEEAAEVLGLPIECAVATEEEFKALTDSCMNVLNNCMNVFKESIDLDDEESVLSESSTLLVYLADGFEIKLKADLDKNIYTVSFEAI